MHLAIASSEPSHGAMTCRGSRFMSQYGHLQVLVATPGRLQDFLGSGAVDLHLGCFPLVDEGSCE